MGNNNKEEPRTAPQSDRWYNLKLGDSFKEDSSSKYCTLRYEFKPASIDKTKAGSMHKNKENRVSVEFQNNQPGKPKVSFEGSSEDYKEHDAVLFFDGETFRLERLHRAVKQLRLLRVPGESATAAASSVPATASAQPGPAVETRLSPPPAAIGKVPKPMHVGKSSFPPLPVEVEQIDVGEPQIPGTKGGGKGINSFPHDPFNISTSSPSPKNDDIEEHQDIDIEDIFGSSSPMDVNTTDQKTDVGFDIKKPRNDTDDDEIADVDDSGDEAEKGSRNAAEALKEQVNAEQGGGRTSSSSSGSSGSGSDSSSSSSSDSEGSDEDSVNSI